MSAEWDQIPLGPTLQAPEKPPKGRIDGPRVRIWVPNDLRSAISARLEADRRLEPGLTYSELLRRALEAYFGPQEASDGR